MSFTLSIEKSFLISILNTNIRIINHKRQRRIKLACIALYMTSIRDITAHPTKKSGSTAFKPVLPLFCEFIPLLYNIRNTLLFNNFPSSLQNKLGDASKPDTTPEPPYRHEYIRNCDTATPLHLL